MIPSFLRPSITATLWLLGACAAGFVLALLLLVAAARPADALQVPGVGEVLQDPVGTVTKTVSPEPSPAAPAESTPAPTASPTPAPNTAPPSASPAPASTPVPAAKPALAPVTDTVANVTSDDPLPTAADEIVESPGLTPASDTPTLLGPAGGAPGLDALAGVTNQLPAADLPALDLGTVDLDGNGGLPTVTLPKADLGSIDTGSDNGLALTLPSVDLGSIDTGSDNGLALTLPSVDLGSVNAGGDGGLALTLPKADLGAVNLGGDGGLSLALPAVDLGGVDTSGGGLTLPSIVLPSIDIGGTSAPPIGPPQSNIPDLGGAARRLTAPTGAPLPLNSDAATVLGAGISTESPGALELIARGQRAFAASVSALSSSAPLDPQPFDMPASPSSPSAPASSSGATGDGPTRTQTLVWNFAIVLAIAALALEASRWFALRNRLPQSQFLTLLIERPG